MNRTRNCLGIASLCALVSGMPFVASAKPKTGTYGVSCSCMCDAPTGAGGSFMQVQTYTAPEGSHCGDLEGATCNLDNPYTGGVATGSLLACGNATTRSAIIMVPFGGWVAAPSRR
jgi:hypothetical protein